MYDVATGVERRITNNSELQTLPSIDGERIVWKDYRNTEGEDSGELDVYMYDLQKNKETRLTQDGYYYENPVICGDTVVWIKIKGMSGGLYSYDIPSGKETLLLEYKTERDCISDFDLDGKNIAYSKYDFVNGDQDCNIYMISMADGSDVQIVIVVVIVGIAVGGFLSLAFLRRKKMPRGPKTAGSGNNTEKTINTGEGVEVS
jgi:beta propeller repeat protein